MIKIIAGIVLYNPDINRLKENIDAIISQVDRLVLVDNGCQTDDYMQVVNDSRIVILKHNINLGIATALNAILQYALDNDYDWALTLDQDSVSPSNLIEVYRNVISGKEHLGMVCCKIHDRNFMMQREESMPQEDGYIELCITSASMVNVQAWQDVGGFDDQMFIDSVDFDFCIMLRKRGWKIFKTYKTELLHEVGHSKVIKILGKEYLALNHSPFRYYYIVRNTIYEGRKHGFLFRSILRVMRAFWTVIRFEDLKYKKITRMLRGIFDGFRMKISQPKKRTKNKL